MPAFRPMLQLLITRSASIIITEANSQITETKSSSVTTGTVAFRAIIIIDHGSPSPINISKIFEPTALLKAIPPLPCFATITEEIISGTEVPTAKTVNATITLGISSTSDMTIALSTRTQLKPAINKIEIKNTQ